MRGFVISFLLGITDSSHRILINDEATEGQEDAYGISPGGAVVAIRPDGYVGTVVPLHELGYLTQYFSGTMTNSSASVDIIPIE